MRINRIICRVHEKGIEIAFIDAPLRDLNNLIPMLNEYMKIADDVVIKYYSDDSDIKEKYKNSYLYE